MYTQFESGHPDKKPAPIAGNGKIRLAHFGAAKSSKPFGFSSETLNQTLEQMLKSIQIRDFNLNPNKRWYVEYREWNPITQKFERVREYRQINREKDPSRRQQLIQNLFAEISAHITKRFTAEKQAGTTITHYIQQYTTEKGQYLRKTTMKNYTGSLQVFTTWLHQAQLQACPLAHITRQHMQQYRQWLLPQMSNRSVNNHIDFVRTFFNWCIDTFEHIITTNPCRGLSKLPNTSETHVAYTTQQLTQIFEHLRHTDPQMLLYCQFVGLGFLRCKEARQIRVADIDFVRKTITISAGYAKSRRRQLKPMLGMFAELLTQYGLHKQPRSNYVFTISGCPGAKPVHENYFQKRFAHVKKHFGLSTLHTIYGFRHTFVCQLLDSGQPWTEIMKYTGHTTFDAFQKYARSISNKPAADLSQHIHF